MNPNDEEGIDREAWRRRLGDAGEPAPITDLRIRTEARRAVTPRIGHWWLPASLAASLVLAVFVVQWQLEDDGRAPVVRESDTVRQEMPAQAPAYVIAPPPTDAIPAPMVAIPEMAAEAPLRREKTREAELERRLDEFAPAPSPREERSATSAAGQEAAPAAEDLENVTVTGTFSQRTRGNIPLRTPEQWYADVESLRAAGKHAEADAELERLEEAYPGWLARRQSGNP